MFDGFDPNDPVSRNLLKALGHLATGLAKVTVEAFERRSAEKKAESDARIAAIQSLSSQISEQVEVSEEYVKAAGDKFARKIVGQQWNLDKIVGKARDRLQEAPQIGTSADSSVGEISDDWLNRFRDEACEKSSEEAQELFSKVLAGEIRSPGAFSLKALTVLGDMDQKVATLFNTFCSLCVVKLEDPDGFLKSSSNFEIVEARVPIVRDVFIDGAIIPPSTVRNWLIKFAEASIPMYQEYGLDFNEFQLLSEYGLVEDNTYIEYSNFWHNNQLWGVFKRDANPPFEIEDIEAVNLSGLFLSSVGKELFHIVELNSPPEYLKRLIGLFEEYYEVKIVAYPRQ